MSVRAKVSLGRWKGGRPQRSGERGDPIWKHQDKECTSGRAVQKDGGSWTTGSGRLGVLTLWTVKFGRGWAGRRRRETAPDGPGGIHEGLEPHFPGGASLPPPRDPAGRGAHIWRSWTTYRGAWEPAGVSSCQAGVPVRAGWEAGTEEGGWRRRRKRGWKRQRRRGPKSGVEGCGPVRPTGESSWAWASAKHAQPADFIGASLTSH